MNNDLISRSALKRRFNDISDSFESMTFPDIIAIIDTAPTVAEDYDTGYQDGLEDGLNDIRPHGKWVFDKENSFTIDMFRCSSCGCFGATSFKFCPNCGAKMEAENDTNGIDKNT